MSTSRNTGTADLSPTGPATYEVRFFGDEVGASLVALTATVRAETRMDAIAIATEATGQPREAIESVKEV